MASALTQKGFTLVSAGSFEEAQEVFDEALASAPEDLDALLGLALCSAHLGDRDQALELAVQAGPGAARDVWLWDTYCRVISVAGTKEQALGAAREATRLFPNSASAHHALAQAAAYLGKKTEAFAAAHRGLQLNSGTIVSYIVLSNVAIEFGDWKEAEKAARGALKIDPDNAEALNNLWVAMEKRGKHRWHRHISDAKKPESIDAPEESVGH